MWRGISPKKLKKDITEEKKNEIFEKENFISTLKSQSGCLKTPIAKNPIGILKFYLCKPPPELENEQDRSKQDNC